MRKGWGRVACHEKFREIPIIDVHQHDEEFADLESQPARARLTGRYLKMRANSNCALLDMHTVWFWGMRTMSTG